MRSTAIALVIKYTVYNKQRFEMRQRLEGVCVCVCVCEESKREKREREREREPSERVQTMQDTFLTVLEAIDV